MTTPLSYPLHEATLESISRCGGKAARLGEALRLGFPVPEGQVLSTDLYRRLLQQGGLQGEISSILSIMQPSAMAHFQAAEWAIREAFRARRLPEDVAEVIHDALQALGGGPVAVRSSATSEDSSQQSFVGQHATCLSAQSEQDVVNSVVECWMSLFSAKALSYAYRFQIDLLNSAMAVLLQVVVHPTQQGVLFTVDPITGDPGQFVMELSSDGGYSQYRLDPYEDQPNHPSTWHRIREMGLLLDERLHAYQALEWGVADGQLYLLRVRPVTGTPPYLPVSAKEVAAAGGRLELAHTDRLSPRALAPLSRFHRGRVRRLNAAYFRRVTRLFQPCARRDDHVLYGYLYSGRQRANSVPATTPGTLPWWILAAQRIWAARALDHEFRTLLRTARPRLQELSERNLPTLTDSALCEHLAEVMALHEAFEEQRGRLGACDVVLAEILEHLHRAWLDDAADLPDLLRSGDDPLSDRDAVLCRLARAAYAHEEEREEAFAAFLRRYRHLYLGGDPLAYTEDTALLHPDESVARAALRQYGKAREVASAAEGAEGVQGPPTRADSPTSASEDEPCDQRSQRGAEREAAEERVLPRLTPAQRSIYLRALRLAQRYAPLGSERDEPALLCCMLEHDALLELGRRLVLAGLAENETDASMLGVRDLFAFLRGELAPEDVRNLLSERREIYRRWRRYTPPKVLDAAAMQEEDSRSISGVAGEQLRGLAVCRGYSEGRARVATTPSEASRVVPGEILVCREVLYDLTPWLGIVSAVVAETGGLLGDSAVLTREYGVPAVFAVPDATKRLHTGDELVVDATRGLVVRRHEEPVWDLI